MAGRVTDGGASCAPGGALPDGAVDLAGHGQSGVGRRSWTMAAFGEDVVAVVEQLGLGELGEPSTEEELEAFLAPFREDFAAATRGLVERLFTADADAELLE